MAWKRIIHLTSPMMHGPDVKEAQQKLTKNRFKENYQPGKADGVWGEDSMRAVKRAKFWLGYPKSAINGQYGRKLDDFITGQEKLPALFRLRRSQRKKAAADVPIREKALKLAISQIGTVESPRGSNQVKYASWYGAAGPWCAMFATWCYVNSGSKSMQRGVRAAYVPWVVQAGRQGDYGFAIVGKPEPGDLVCYDWNKDGVSDHIGLFEKWTSNTEFTAIEGNTSEGNDSNGGEVMRRNRNRGQVKAFVRCH